MTQAERTPRLTSLQGLFPRTAAWAPRRSLHSPSGNAKDFPLIETIQSDNRPILTVKQDLCSGAAGEANGDLAESATMSSSVCLITRQGRISGRNSVTVRCQQWCKLPGGGRGKMRARSSSNPARPYIRLHPYLPKNRRHNCFTKCQLHNSCSRLRPSSPPRPHLQLSLRQPESLVTFVNARPDRPSRCATQNQIAYALNLFPGWGNLMLQGICCNRFWGDGLTFSGNLSGYR